MCCAQLVDCVPTMESKLYAATQVVDEARHVEAFHRYLSLMDKSYPIAGGLKKVIDAILAADSWQTKSLGMQIMLESLAMGFFRNMMIQAEDPILRRIVQLTAHDEARHVGFGIVSLAGVIPRMSEKARSGLEDFTLTAIGILQGRDGAGGVIDDQAVIDAGIDPQEMRDSIAREREEAIAQPSQSEQRSVLRDYLVPNLDRVGLISDRIRPLYEEHGLIRNT